MVDRRLKKNAICPILVLGALLLALAACTSAGRSVPSAPSATTSDRLQHAIELLQAGNAREADTELHVYLKDIPDSHQALYLIAQIETPLQNLYPNESFSVKLAKDESLSSLARTYLGNSLGFYGLARFNAIAVPQLVVQGQSIRIPKTAEAVAALARRNAPAPITLAPLSPPAPPASKESRADQHRNAQQYYRHGVIAFQHQDLDAAIAFWTKCLEIEPDNNEAAVSRTQAVTLKDNLAKLRNARSNVSP